MSCLEYHFHFLFFIVLNLILEVSILQLSVNKLEWNLLNFQFKVFSEGTQKFFSLRHQQEQQVSTEGRDRGREECSS